MWARLLPALAIGLASVGIVPAVAQPSVAAATATEKARIETIDLDGPDQRRFRISIAYPDKPAPAEGYPVIYVLDGNALFPTVADSVRMQGGRPDWTGIRQALVVGIGYPSETLYGSRSRGYDLTPKLAGAAEQPREARGPASGGADALLAFIEEKVKPLVQTKASVNRAEQTLLGYSLGGVCALHSFFTRPGDFSNYIAISPSAWWGEGYLVKRAEAFAASGKQTKARILLTVGEYEQELSPAARASPGAAEQKAALDRYQMVDGIGALATALERVEGLTVLHRLLPGEDHASGPPYAISLGLRFALLPNGQFPLRP